MASKIIGCGGYLPKKILTNEDLTQFIDTDDEWIRARTGIHQRHIAEADEFSSHMAHKASIAALSDANIDAEEIDLIIACTTTPDNSFPGIANKLHGYLKLSNIPSFDLQAVCSGFIYGIQVADSMIKSGKYKTVLLVCAEKMTSLLEWRDRSISVLFGDGAGAIILQQNDSDSGVLDSNIYSDGSMYNILHTDGGVSSTRTSGTIKMKGSAVFKLAVEKMSESVNFLLESNGLKVSDIDHIVPHQANLRIINSVAKKCGINIKKVITTVQNHANCSAASIPLALSELKSSKLLQANDLVIFTAFGAGTTWGSVLIKW